MPARSTASAGSAMSLSLGTPAQGCARSPGELETFGQPSGIVGKTKGYLSFFSRFPSMSNSCFWPPNSAAPFPLSLSPSIVRV